MTSLVWFRRDLRTTDQPALLAAAAGEGSVHAVVVFTPETWREHGVGANQLTLLCRRAQSLRAELDELGIPLHAVHASTFAATPDALLALAEEIGADRLHHGLEHEVDERERDEVVRLAFEDAGKRVHAHHTQTLLPPDAVQTGTGGPYKVFTPYKRSVLKQLTAEGDLVAGLRPEQQAEPCEAIGSIPDAIEGAGTTVELGTFDLNEKEALAGLDGFLAERGAQYEAQRNFPAVAGTSGLGVAFALGTLSPRTAYAHALRRLTSHPNEAEGLDTWISELVWRDFYRHVLFHFPRVCMNRPFDLATEAVEWRNHEVEFQAWCEGRTGYPLVDAAQRCLVATGWMHNRLRMVTAQFLTKHLLVDWRWGERFFAQHLVDYDFASNNGGWQWSSSTGTDAAPYFRVFNPISQSEKFDADGAFIRQWVPELAELRGKDLHDPSRIAPLLRSDLDYPELIVAQKFGRQRAIDAFKTARASL